MALRYEQGLCISGKTVLKLMREEGLRCQIRRKKYNSYRGEQGKVAPNILARKFKADKPLQKLVTDVTEFSLPFGKAYLSPIMDLYNNEIVSWSISRNPNTRQIIEMLDGVEHLPIEPGAILHSDQGWQYQQKYYQKRLADLGMVQSMSRKATCLDNACMEGFFGHMKDEFYRKQKFETFEDFKSQLNRYIKYWNEERYQLKLKELTPVQYRSQFLKAS